MSKSERIETYQKSLFDELSSDEELGLMTQNAPDSESSTGGKEWQLEAEKQIRERQKVVDYNMKDYPVEVLVSKFVEGLSEDENEFFIPYYQREFTWNLRRQSRFIESILLGLPIPPLFLAGQFKDITEDDGRLEIVDGSQRIRTLDRYLNGQLRLAHLDKLPQLNGSIFTDLDLSRQRKFKRHLIRIIELSDHADEEVRRDLFERINTGSDVLEPIEVRRGAQSGPYFDFLDRLVKESEFTKLVPVGPVKGRRRESQELLLRFFAYTEDYLSFTKEVDTFLTTYIKKHQNDTENEQREQLLHNVLKFVSKNFPNGFRKGANYKTVPRVRFEAIAVGTAEALKIDPSLADREVDVSSWISSDKFRQLTTADGSNSAPRLRTRIEYVRDRLLEKT